MRAPRGSSIRLPTIDSYCGGIPEPKARNAPLSYKVSWNFDMVLMSQNRASVLVEDGARVEVPAADQHDNRFIHEIAFEGLGPLEAFPNGDAPHYAAMIGGAMGCNAPAAIPCAGRVVRLLGAAEETGLPVGSPVAGLARASARGNFLADCSARSCNMVQGKRTCA